MSITKIRSRCSLERENALVMVFYLSDRYAPDFVYRIPGFQLIASFMPSNRLLRRRGTHPLAFQETLRWGTWITHTFRCCRQRKQIPSDHRRSNAAGTSALACCAYGQCIHLWFQASRGEASFHLLKVLCKNQYSKTGYEA